MVGPNADKSGQGDGAIFTVFLRMHFVDDSLHQLYRNTYELLVSQKSKLENFQWSVQEQNRRRCNIKSCCQAKQFMQAVNIRLTQYAVRLSRKDLRLLVGLLTGHNTLNRHITLLRRMDDPLCPLCKEEDTSLHLLGNC